MAEQVRSAQFLVNTALETPGVLEELKAKPEETLKKLAEQATQQVPRALEQDKWIYRIVVGSLGFVTIAVVLGAITISFKANGQAAQIPDVLTALGSAAIGALAGILAPSPTGTKS